MMMKAHCKKPAYRLWISSQTDKAIKEGFQNLKPAKEYDNLYNAARCRECADWLVGINFTRLFTIRYGTKLTVGRVQTPTLALIVERQQAIDNFQAAPYYQLQGIFGTLRALWHRGNLNRVEDKSQAEKLQRELTGMAGVTTTFIIEPDKITLKRSGKLNSQMVFQEGISHDSLYQMDFGALMLTVGGILVRFFG